MAEASRSHARHAHREALAALTRAEQRATAAQQRLDAARSSDVVSVGGDRIGSIREDVRALRARLLDEMSSATPTARP